MQENVLQSMVDGFFFLYPHRNYFVFTEPEPEPGVDTFVVFTRALDVVAFNRVRDKDSVAAATLADWFSDTDEGQETIARMIAGLDQERRRGDEIQARGELVLMPTSDTAH